MKKLLAVLFAFACASLWATTSTTPPKVTVQGWQFPLTGAVSVAVNPSGTPLAMQQDVSGNLLTTTAGILAQVGTSSVNPYVNIQGWQFPLTGVVAVGLNPSGDPLPLQVDVNGNLLTSGSGGGGTPGGSTTQVQYNNAGAFGGITGATTNGTTLTLVAPVLGAATATSINGNTFTTGTYTLTGTASKTLNFTNTLTLSGTDSTTMTFPTTSATLARTDAGNTFTGLQTGSFSTTNTTVADGAGTLTPAVGSQTNILTFATSRSVTHPSAVDGNSYMLYFQAANGVAAITFSANVYREGDPDTAFTVYTPGPAGNHSALVKMVNSRWMVFDDTYAVNYAEDAGANDTYVITPLPAFTAYTTGGYYRFKANTANTGAATININGLGAKTIVKVAGGITTTLADNDIRAGQWVDLTYDGTNMQMQSTLGNAASGGATLGLNTFTRRQTITQGTANESVLVSTGYSLTGSDATNMIDLAGTWNTSGAPTGIKLRITNTASNGSAALMDLGTAAGGSTFFVGPGGATTIGGSFGLSDNSKNISISNRFQIVGGNVDGKISFINSGGSAAATIVGTTTNDSAAAGGIGEIISSAVVVGSAVSLTTNTTANMTSISLTAGDWDVQGNVNFTAGSATVTAMSAGITSTSVTVPSDGTEGYSGTLLTVTSAIDTITLPRKRMSLTGTTTVYIVGRSTFSAGTNAVFGSITARRVR